MIESKKIIEHLYYLRIHLFNARHENNEDSPLDTAIQISNSMNYLDHMIWALDWGLDNEEIDKIRKRIKKEYGLN